MSENQPPPYPGPEGYPPPGSYPPPGAYPPAGPYPPPPPGYGYPTAPFPYVLTYSFGAAIEWGWRKFTQNVGRILLGILVYVVVTAIVDYLSSVAVGQGFWQYDGFSGPWSVTYAVVSALGLLVSFWLNAAWVRASLDVADGRRLDYLDALRRVPFVPVVLASLVAFLLVVLGLLAVLVGAVVMGILVYLTLYAVMDETLGPWTAVRRSISVTWPRFWSALGLAVMNILIVLAGALACGVGLVVAVPVTSFATTFAWRMWSGRTVAP